MGFEKEPVTIPDGDGLEDAIDAFAKDVYTAKPEVSDGEAAMNITPSEKADAVVTKEQEAQEIAEKMNAQQIKKEETTKRIAEEALSNQKESEQRAQEIIKDLEVDTYKKDEVITSDDLIGLLEETNFKGEAHEEVDAIIEGLMSDTDATGNLENVSNKKTGMNEVEDLTKL